MAAIRRSRALVRFWKMHERIYQSTNGLIGSRLLGMPVLLLTTTGRNSGIARTSPLLYLKHDKDVIVVASYAGEPKHPSWFLNLRAHPQVVIQMKDVCLDVFATEAEGQKRDMLWRKKTDMYPNYSQYQNRVERCIPVVILSPKDPETIP
jgi:F420H(2)-dependent quinone reductase